MNTFFLFVLSLFCSSSISLTLLLLFSPSLINAADTSTTATTATATGTVLSPVIQTKSGPIRGRLIHVEEAKQDVYEFKSIPFAEPPIGPLRFKKPQAKQPWTNVLVATRPIKSCVQFDDGEQLGGNNMMPQSEDCLYLNIWVPKRVLDGATTSTTTKLPVYFYIHGGFFTGGSSAGRLYNGTVFTGHQNVIFVSANYRLGPLGFAYFGRNNDANVGLWDQLAALSWTSENIEAFGGNKSRLTIGGDNAGAASVTYHLISPQSRKYFQRAIVQSGSALAAWANMNTSTASQLIDHLVLNVMRTTTAGACTVARGNNNSRSSLSSLSLTTADEQLKCLRAVNASSLVECFHALDSAPLPVVDGDFVPRDPSRMLASGDIYKVPLLIGFTQQDDDTSWFLDDEFLSDVDETAVWSHYPSVVDDALAVIGLDNAAAAASEAIANHYMPLEWTRDAVLSAASQIITDYTETCPTYSWANYTANTKDAPPLVYVYRYTESKVDDSRLDAYHTIQLAYLFGEPFAPYSTDYGYIPYQASFSTALMTYWGNFIKFGDPLMVEVNPGCPEYTFVTVPRHWPAFHADHTCEAQVIELNIETSVTTCRDAVICKFKADDCQFWEFV